MTDKELHEKNRIILAAHKEIAALKEVMLEADDELGSLQRWFINSMTPRETNRLTEFRNTLREAAK